MASLGAQACLTWPGRQLEPTYGAAATFGVSRLQEISCGLSTAGWGKPPGGVPPGFSTWNLRPVGSCPDGDSTGPADWNTISHHQSRILPGAEVQPGTRLATALVSGAQVGSEANSASLHVSPERDASFRAWDLHGSDLRS